MLNRLTISDKEYGQIKHLLYDRFGIDLGTGKKALVLGRMQKVLHKDGFDSFADYYKYLCSDESGLALNTLINRLSTNHTYFNRENAHFDFFSQSILPAGSGYYELGLNNDFRVWSAGCSSGEEAYTLSMLLHQHGSMNRAAFKYSILGTDISEKALEKAQSGIYSADNVGKMDGDLKRKYFTASSDGNFKILPAIKDRVLFRRLNLMRPRFPFKRRFHVIFCRNVMIYFDNPTRQQLIRKFYDNLENNGFLFIGHSESMGRSNAFFNYVQPAVYQKISS